MIYRSLLPITLLLLAPILATAQDVTGSYNFQVMSGDAEEEHPVATGSFVIMQDPVPTTELPADLVEEARRESQSLLFPDATPSACFGFRMSTQEVDGREFYGGIIPGGLTTWEIQGDTVRVVLYRSPDASMGLAGTYEGRRITGVVRQHESYGGKIVDRLPFEAERTGPASVGTCEAAIRESQQFDRE